MAVIKITNDVYSVGVLNPHLRVFDIIMETKFGTSYNAYLIKGGEKLALVETVHEKFFDEYIENVKQVCDLSKIEYLIMNHNEPDHSGSVAKLLNILPNITLVASQAGGVCLKAITNRPGLKLKVVKDGDTLDLGGKELNFINAPFLHWPDSMFTYSEQDKALFTCDFLGCHYCEPTMFDYGVKYNDDFEESLHYYYDCIMGPFKPHVLKGLEKIKGLDIQFACTSHGPVLTAGHKLPLTIKRYELWSTPKEKGNVKIPIFYCSAYGYTGRLADAIQEGILEEIPQAEAPVYDIIEHDMDMLAGKLNESDGFFIGSCTINRDAVPPIWQLLSHIDAINSQKKSCAVFGSYGWSGEAVPAIMQRLKDLRLCVLENGLKVNFVPSGADLNKAKELGREFAKQFKN